MQINAVEVDNIKIEAAADVVVAAMSSIGAVVIDATIVV